MNGSGGREAVHETVDLTTDPSENLPGVRASIADIEVTVVRSRLGRLARKLSSAAASVEHLVIMGIVSVPLLGWLIACLLLDAPGWLVVGGTGALLFLLGTFAALLRTETAERRRQRLSREARRRGARWSIAARADDRASRRSVRRPRRGH